MVSLCSIWIAAVIAGCHLLFSVKDIEAVQTISAPGDQNVVNGYNNSHIEMKWTIDLQGGSFGRTVILKTLESGSSSGKALYSSAGDPKIPEEFQNRMNVTNVINSSIITVTLVIRNVTLSDEAYYKVQVEDKNFNQAADILFLTIYDLPGVEIYSEKQSYFENQTITLHCNATAGKPAPTISWIQVNNPSRSFPGGSSLTIPAANGSDAGQYKCIATNNAGSDTASINITVIPFSIPSFDFVSSNQTAVVGNTVNLHCNASGYPTPKILWTREGNDSVISTNNSLILSQVTKEDSGLYICTAVNHMGNKEKVVFVDVQFAPEISQSPQSIVVNESDSMSLFCNASGNPPAVITWTKEGDSNFREHGEKLLLTNVTKNDKGRYICTAFNGIGQNATANATVTVQYKPRGTVIQSNLTNNLVEKPAGIKVNCTADAVPIPHLYKFFIDDKNLGESSNGVLELSSDSLPYLSTIKCVPHNRYWTGEEAEINVTVHVAPEISQSPQSIIVNESDSKLLFCNASGNPSAVITWTKKGDSNFRRTGETLLLTNVTRNDKGTYICTAFNGIGQNATANATVTVQYKPRATVIQSNLTNNLVEKPARIKLNCTADAIPTPNLYEFFIGSNKLGDSSDGVLELSSDSLPYLSTIKCVPHSRYWTGEVAEINITVHDKPEITNVTTKPETWIGKTVTIECIARGNPRPNITWSRGNGVDTFTSHEVHSTLNITPATNLDFGIYTCSATNLLGETNKSISLLQQTKPGIPTVETTDIEGESMTVHWKAPADDGGHAITSYHVTVDDGSGTKKTCNTAGNETSCVINKIRSSADAYVVIVKAENGVGYGNTATVRLDVKQVQIKFSKEPCDIEVTTKGTSRYEEKTAAFITEIKRVYNREKIIKLYGITVSKLRCGSITATFDMVFLTNETNYLEPLKKETENGKLGTFDVDKSSIKEVEEPEEETGFNKFWDSLPLGAKVGFIIGLCLLVILIVYLIVMCFIKCRKNRKSSGSLETGIGMKNYSNKAYDTETENGLVITKKQPQGETKQRNGHSKQDMQTGKKVKASEDVADSGENGNKTLNSTVDLAAISTDADAQNSLYIPRARRWDSEDYLY